MRNTITKTVSMFLVAVMVMGIAVMPMRAYADVADLIIDQIPDPVWREVVRLTKNVAKEMLDPVNNSPDDSAVSRFSAYFQTGLTDSFYYVTAQQMNELSAWLVQNGIEVMPAAVPGRELIALTLLDEYVPTATGTVRLDANVGDYYTHSGKTVVRVGVDGTAGEDMEHYTGTSSTDTTVGITPDGELIDIPEENKDSGSTSSGPTINWNNTTNNWQVKNENGIYVDVNGFHYNPVTQTYDITTIDNRHYTYQFYYDYTYITYIGSSAEYREAYKVYYELPDGRSSGDLTADELKGLSLQFDMVNYDKAASDTLTQALFPFDGDLDNISYYNASAQWVSGASTEYLEASEGFGGALVYDRALLSRLNFNASSAFSVSDGFTIQSRMYLYEDDVGQFNFCLRGSPYFPRSNSTTTISSSAPVTYYSESDSDDWYNLFGIYQGNLRFRKLIFTKSGSNYKLSFDVVSIPLPVGAWFDFTLVYVPPSSGYSSVTLNDYVSGDSPFYHFYVNGVLVGSTAPYVGEYVYRGYYRYLDSSSALTFTFDDIGGQYYSAPAFSDFSGFTYFSPQTSGNLILLDNLRIVSTALYTGVQSFTPTPVPFDTNLVYVLPSVSGLNDNTVAIMSQLPVSGYRVGGIRPTDPTLPAGYVYMHIDGEFVDSVQQYNGSYWEEVTARLYTGVRWIPVTAFNVYTLEDMFDIIDPDADGGGNSVDSIYQYYLWWSGEWGSFQQWLQGTMQTLIEAIQSSNGGGSSGPVVIVPGLNDQTTTNEITTENPDGSTTKTVIVSNAAGLVYSNSVTTYPTDADGNTKTITVYTDSSGVMYQTVTIIDKDGNVTVTEPTQATGTLGAILKMITSGVMSIAGTVIEGFVTIVVDGVKFIIDSADKVLSGMGDLVTQAAGSIQDLVDSVSPNIDTGPEQEADSTVESVGFLDGILMIYPSQFRNAFNAMVLIGISLGLLALFIL